MTKPKVLFIDSDSEYIKGLKSYFSNSDIVEVIDFVNDGNVAYETFLSHMNDIDIVVMDILLTSLDGLSLISKIKKLYLKTKFIICSSFAYTDYYNLKNDIDVLTCYIKPVPFEVLEKNIIHRFNYYKYRYDSLLTSLGFTLKGKGYLYIVEALMLMMNVDIVENFSKDIYSLIADKYDTNISCVERNIRHAIEVSFPKGKYSLIDDLFGYSINEEKGKPTNIEFLIIISHAIKGNVVKY